MPGPQFDELKLQVSLTDNATPQLRQIKSALDELGTGSQANNIDRLRRHTSEVDEALRKLIDTVSKGPIMSFNRNGLSTLRLDRGVRDYIVRQCAAGG